jgi:ABC-type uncharacterized transport system YnjBCD substrate-binding protein
MEGRTNKQLSNYQNSTTDLEKKVYKNTTRDKVVINVSSDSEFVFYPYEMKTVPNSIESLEAFIVLIKKGVIA